MILAYDMHSRLIAVKHITEALTQRRGYKKEKLLSDGTPVMIFKTDDAFGFKFVYKSKQHGAYTQIYDEDEKSLQEIEDMLLAEAEDILQELYKNHD